MIPSALTIVVDAMCAQFGGNRTFVEGLLAAWSREFPADTLHVLVREDDDLDTGCHVRHAVRVRTPVEIGRPWAQTRHMSRLVRSTGADVVLATAPTTTVRRPGSPLAIVVHDLRHEILPHQFTWSRRRLRDLSYGRSYRIVDGVVGVSRRTLEDLHRLHPRTTALPSAVAHLGADHVADWGRGTGAGPAVAFGHHSNKNPHLVVEAWALMRARGTLPSSVTILGLGEKMRSELQERITRHGLDDVVELARFLPEDEFRRVVTEASLIVLPSDFEGFGLPIVEGMLLGLPVVIGPDPGALEAAGGHAVVARDWSPEAVAEAIETAADRSAAELEAAEAWASRFTWARTAGTVRDVLVRLAKSPG